jgi:hypothetical protein
MKYFSPRNLTLIAASVVVLAGAIWWGRPISAAFNGAIYTSTFDGQIVNQNLYPSKDAVYLNGGPQNLNGKGLPNGEYYFQVTTPSGAKLLSTDNLVCRQVQVTNGAVNGYGPDAAAAGCAHANGNFNLANNSIPLQLVPFDDTSNNGGEYKVWLIRKSSTTVPDPDGLHVSFNGGNSKTDNFKVQITTPTPTPCGDDCVAPTFSIGGTKFYDANANGLNDDGQSVGGVQINITLTDPDTLAVTPVVTFTAPDGSWSVPNLKPGTTYVVSETLPPDCPDGSHWVETAPAADANGNRSYSGTVPNSNVTGLDFGNLCEHPGSGGFTLGFWSNKNGQAAMGGTNAGGVNGHTSDVYVLYGSGSLVDNASCASATTQGLNCDLAFLRRFNLFGESTLKKQVVTTPFDPGNYPDFKSWLLSANAYNMSYMLSAQLAANSLDVRHGMLNDNTIVDANSVCNTVGSCLGFVTIGQVRQLANQSLGSAGGNTTISGDPQRDSQELMKNFLDAVNNNRLYFVNTSPCCVVYPPPAP